MQRGNPWTPYPSMHPTLMTEDIEMIEIDGVTIIFKIVDDKPVMGIISDDKAVELDLSTAKAQLFGAINYMNLIT